MPSNSIKSAAALLKSNGVSLFRNASGEFQIRLCNSARNAPYYFTDDLEDAVAMGLRMANERNAAKSANAAAESANAAWKNYDADYDAAYDAANAAAESANAAAKSANA
jgi:predicted DNA-binding transcriptional regulator YafY